MSVTGYGYIMKNWKSMLAVENNKDLAGQSFIGTYGTAFQWQRWQCADGKGYGKGDYGNGRHSGNGFGTKTPSEFPALCLASIEQETVKNLFRSLIS